MILSTFFHTSTKTEFCLDIGITTILSKERFISFIKKGKATVQLMYSQYGKGGVLPKGQNHKPRRVPSRKWCEITATTNMYGRDRRNEMFCANHTCSIGTTMKTTVVAWRNGLLLRWRASWKNNRAIIYIAHFSNSQIQRLGFAFSWTETVKLFYKFSNYGKLKMLS